LEIENKIEQRYASEIYEYFKFGYDYYRTRNTAIMDREKKVYLEGLGVQSNPFGANHKIPSGHLKKLVDQKVNYLIGNGIYWSDEKQREPIDEYFETSFDEFLNDMAIETSKKAESWAYAYKKNGKLKFIAVPPEQLTPIYDEFNELAIMVREYDNVRLVYDTDKVIRYEKVKDKGLVKISEYGHYTMKQMFNGRQVGEPEENSFGVVPFIPLFNNKEKISDLYPIKPKIDIYDIINSDFANNIDDMQEAFFTLKGYSGDTKNLSKFMTQLKKLKVVPIGDDGEVGVHQLKVPVEARETFLNRVQTDIYKDSMGVDLSSLSGSSITNTVIKAMFADLDLKCDGFENEIRKFITHMIDFINMVDGKTLSNLFTLERSMIMNQSEFIETILKTLGIYSAETIRELLPYEVDLEEEKKRIEGESGAISLDETEQDLELNL